MVRSEFSPKFRPGLWCAISEHPEKNQPRLNAEFLRYPAWKAGCRAGWKPTPPFCSNVIKTSEDPFQDYLWLHATFARIHPFADGNGRMARLLANLPLLAAGLHPVDIPATARDRYLESLARWQIACGPPDHQSPLYENAELLADFAALCISSRAL
jgi:hypothetical protein